MALPRSRARTLAATGAILGLLTGGGLWLRDSAVVRVEEVVVTGLSGPQAAQVREALTRAARDMTTLHVREDALERAVEPFHVVRDLDTDADLLKTLRITVHEYAPVAAVPVAGRRIPVAADGTLLRDNPAKDLALLATRVSAAGEHLDRGRPRKLLDLVAAAPAPLRARVEKAFLGPEGLTVVLRDGPRLRFGPGIRVPAKWAAASRVLSHPGSAGAAYLDLRVPERPAAGGLPPDPVLDGQATDGTAGAPTTTPQAPPAAAAPQAPPAATAAQPATPPAAIAAPVAASGQP